MPFDIVKTADGSLTLRHPELQQLYHSHCGAKAEARALYLDASGILGDFASRQADLRVADIGLGLGYNALTTLSAWLEHSQPTCDLHVDSFESDRELIEKLISSEPPWGKNWPDSWKSICANFVEPSSSIPTTKIAHANGRHLSWRIHRVNLQEMDFSSWSNKFQYVWHDPFSPEKNPKLWESCFFLNLRNALDKHAVLMSYSVAGTVRRALQEAGFDTERIATPLKKRHWLRATRRMGGDDL